MMPEKGSGAGEGLADDHVGAHTAGPVGASSDDAPGASSDGAPGASSDGAPGASPIARAGASAGDAAGASAGDAPGGSDAGDENAGVQDTGKRRSDLDGSTSGVSDFGISPSVPFDEGQATGEAPVAVRREPHPHDPRFELSAALRRLITATVGANLTDADVNTAAAALAGIATDLERRAGPGRRPRSQPDPAGHPQEFFPTSPVIGFANPIAPPVVVESVEGGLVGRAWFDYPYEGPPTCVHGGIIALVFDELLGAANIAAGCPGMTGTLTIRYLKPTPLRTALRLEARCESQQGRKIRSRGTIYCEDEITAEAEGIFIQLVPERFIDIIAHGKDIAEVLEQVRSDARHLGFDQGGEPQSR